MLKYFALALAVIAAFAGAEMSSLATGAPASVYLMVAASGAGKGFAAVAFACIGLLAPKHRFAVFATAIGIASIMLIRGLSAGG